jgi:hypothetical protein
MSFARGGLRLRGAEFVLGILEPLGSFAVVFGEVKSAR